MEPTPSAPEPAGDKPKRSPAVTVSLTLLKIVLGVGLLLVVMWLTILDNDSPATEQNASVTTVGPSFTSPSVDPQAVTTIPLTPLQMAKANGGYVAVTAAVDPLRIYDKVPPGSTLLLSFPVAGIKQNTATFLAIGEAVDPEGASWYQIRVPKRPNGTTGWVRAEEVTFTYLTGEIRIDLSDHQLDLYELGQKVRSFPVAVGKKATPTVVGDFYVTDKSQPVKTRNKYGDRILMLSSFSEAAALQDWPNGAQAGIHGTFDVGGIGKDVSNGCIRLKNDDVIALADSVPVGTPVLIRE